MKKFKRIFYTIYLVTIILVMVISFNIYDALELFKVWGWFKYFSDLPYMGRDLLLFLCALMLVEIIAENIHIARLKARADENNQKIIDLKAKLYDKSEGETIAPEDKESYDAED